MEREFAYPVTLEPDEEEGGFVVTFVDLPEAITQGDDRADALAQAADALEEAIAGRIRRAEGIPEPSAAGAGAVIVSCPAATAGKAALYVALVEAGWSATQLAVRLGCDERQIVGLLDPREPLHLSSLQEALAALGKRLAVRMVDEQAA